MRQEEVCTTQYRSGSVLDDILSPRLDKIGVGYAADTNPCRVGGKIGIATRGLRHSRAPAYPRERPARSDISRPIRRNINARGTCRRKADE